ncbi:unnamed protein product [Orchesella dallaii]|uniref:Glucose-methanol-choline oxidoreductase N-terminal domain-containing protein n=1 Tax=Orchesella dallaii TaxID=48710 RepID=A0ABP1QBQ9_9HEXA
MPWPRGRSLGGSSNHNWMQYMRGNPNDFDLWANLTGDIRWNYQNVLQYFRRLEDYHGHWKGSEAYHGEGGPMNIEGLSFKPALKYWLAAAEELGYPTGFDPNAIQTQGFGPFDVTQKRGVRFSTYRGYIVPNLLNKNLVIRRYAYATKIHFDETMTATGVSYLHHGIPKFAAATKEVVVCAGAINTPQLLLLSGIGPFEHLKEVGIRPVVNLPVGLNLQDHVSAVGHFLADSPVSFIPNRDSSLASGLEYLLYGTGPLTSAAGMGGYGFYSTPKTSPDWPNIFYILTSIGNFKDFGKLQDLLGPYSTNFWEQWMKPTEPSDAHLIWVLLARPKSRGYIKLADANPMSKPIIQPAYFSDSGDEDVEALIDGLQFLVKMYEGTSAFQVAGGRMNPVPMPGCENYIFKSRRYFECVIKTLPQTIYHPSCTCPMGKVGDPRAVLDSELRVIGTRGLRVADASVMPVITNANLNAPTIMIGERCADLIKSTWLPTVTL